MALFLFSPEDMTSMISKNKQFEMWTRQNTPLFSTLSQFISDDSGPEKSSLLFLIYGFCSAFVDSATKCVYHQWIPKVFLSPIISPINVRFQSCRILIQCSQRAKRLQTFNAGFQPPPLMCKNCSEFSDYFDEIMDCIWWNPSIPCDCMFRNCMLVNFSPCNNNAPVLLSHNIVTCYQLTCFLWYVSNCSFLGGISELSLSFVAPVQIFLEFVADIKFSMCAAGIKCDYIFTKKRTKFISLETSNELLHSVPNFLGLYLSPTDVDTGVYVASFGLLVVHNELFSLPGVFKWQLSACQIARCLTSCL